MFIMTSFIYNVVKYNPVGKEHLPHEPDSLEIPHKPGRPDRERIGSDAQVRIYAALFDQGAFGESFGSQTATSTAPAIAAFNTFGECVGVANTVCSHSYPP